MTTTEETRVTELVGEHPGAKESDLSHTQVVDKIKMKPFSALDCNAVTKDRISSIKNAGGANSIAV